MRLMGMVVLVTEAIMDVNQVIRAVSSPETREIKKEIMVRDSLETREIKKVKTVRDSLETGAVSSGMAGWNVSCLPRMVLSLWRVIG